MPVIGLIIELPLLKDKRVLQTSLKRQSQKHDQSEIDFIRIIGTVKNVPIDKIHFFAIQKYINYSSLFFIYSFNNILY